MSRKADEASNGRREFVRVWARTTNGSTEWQRDVTFETFGESSGAPSLSVAGDTLVVPAKAEVVGLDAATGEERWRVARDGRSAVVRNGTIYGGSNGVWAISARDGTEEWSTDLAPSQRPGPVEEAGRGVSVGAVDDRRVYAWGQFGMVTVPLGGSGTPTEWTFYDSLEGDEYGDRATVDTPQPGFRHVPVVADGQVYVTRSNYPNFRGFSGWVTALDAATGERQWRFRGGDDVVVSSAPVVVDGTVYVGSSSLPMENPPRQTGKVHAIDATSGTQKWSVDADDGILTGYPAAVGSRMYFPAAPSTLVHTGERTAERMPIGFGALLYRQKQFASDGDALFAITDRELVALGDG